MGSILLGALRLLQEAKARIPRARAFPAFPDRVRDYTGIHSCHGNRLVNSRGTRSYSLGAGKP
jgi:hypothetical protein